MKLGKLFEKESVYSKAIFWSNIKELDWGSCTKEDKQFFQMALMAQGFDWYVQFNRMILLLFLDLKTSAQFDKLPSAHPKYIETNLLDDLIFSSILRGKEAYSYAFQDPNFLVILHRRKSERVLVIGALPLTHMPSHTLIFQTKRSYSNV